MPDLFYMLYSKKGKVDCAEEIKVDVQRQLLLLSLENAGVVDCVAWRDVT